MATKILAVACTNGAERVQQAIRLLIQAEEEEVHRSIIPRKQAKVGELTQWIQALSFEVLSLRFFILHAESQKVASSIVYRNA